MGDVLSESADKISGIVYLIYYYTDVGHTYEVVIVMRYGLSV